MGVDKGQATITLNKIEKKKRGERHTYGSYCANVTIYCPEKWICECGEYNLEKFCTACGRERKKEPPVQEKSTYWICPSCGAKRDVGESFCGKCGGGKQYGVINNYNECTNNDDMILSASVDSTGMEEEFNNALNLKRHGAYNESIKCYRDYIRKYYSVDSQIQHAFIALGKVYYLNGEYRSALICYDAFIAFTARPEMKSDYDDIISKRATDEQIIRFVQFFSNIARHIGHAIIDESNETYIGCINYKKCLKGGNEEMNDDYEKTCQKIGMDYIENMIKGGMSKEKINRKISEFMDKFLDME